MNYTELKTFLLHKMRMSHIYQPVMIRHLLRHKGKSSDYNIAKELVNYDPSQVEYYQNICNNMVGKVLRKHQIISKDKAIYHLENFEELSKGQIDELISICETKLDEYITKRGERIWSHRVNNREPISGSVRYQVLKRAMFRCELCGISADEKSLEVDHIVPKNLGGEDALHNYQALCYSCNATKRDTDDTDFRGMGRTYNHRREGCVFCMPDEKRILESNNLAFLIRDKFPVTENHLLVIPKRHFSNYFDIHQAELNAIQQLLTIGQKKINKREPSISDFNIGINSGENAGQTIFHCHVHLIPRRKGDIANPRGGVRNIFAGQGDY